MILLTYFKDQPTVSKSRHCLLSQYRLVIFTLSVLSLILVTALMNR